MHKAIGISISILSSLIIGARGCGPPSYHLTYRPTIQPLKWLSLADTIRRIAAAA